MAKYKLTKRANPAKREDPMKWYAIPVVYEQLNTRALSREATDNTTLAPIEFESTMNLFAETLPKLLLKNFSVKVNEVGTFRLSFRSEGVEDITTFNAATMIKDPRIIFTPDKTLLENIRQNASFDNAGVVEDAFTYPSIKEYLEKQVEDRPGTGGGSTGGGGNSGGGSTGGGGNNSGGSGGE
jgi:predicted histone-like DNA-binding protein